MEISIGRASALDVLFFTKHLQIMLKNGLTLSEGVEILQDEAKGPIKNILKKIYQTIISGEKLSTTLAKYPKVFSPVYINMIKIGETAGSLEDSLSYLAVELEKSQQIRRNVKSAMMYPILVFVAVFCLGMSVAIFVLPKILPLFQSLEMELPLSTRILIFIAEIFEKNGWEILIGSIVGIVFLSWLLKRNFMRPLTHFVFLKIPVVKDLVRQKNLESFTRTGSTLLKNGIIMDEALRIIYESTQNRLYKRAVRNFVGEIQAGNTLAAAMQEYPKLFPPIMRKMILVGERTGALEKNMEYLSDFYRENFDNAVKNLSNVLEPVLLIFIGIIVGAVAISILGPIYEITGSLR